MPVHKYFLGKEGVDSRAVEVWQSAAVTSRIDVDYSTLSGSRETKEATIIADLQAGLDTRIEKRTLPLDDPDRTIDPSQQNFFWGDADGTPNAAGDWLIARPVIVVAAPWDAKAEMFILSLRRASDDAIR